MKKLGAILLSFSLLISISPQLTMAAQNATFEQDLLEFLDDVSNERGFEVTKEDIEASLALYEAKIEEYESVVYLKNFLGEVIKNDLSNLDYIYEQHELDEEGLLELLKVNGVETNDYIFLDDLDFAVYSFIEGDFERDPNFDQDLIEYLAYVTEERGFEVTIEAVEASLAIYGMSLDEFETVEDLKNFLGEVINADLSNLDYFYEVYELDQEALLQLLAENGDDINNYIYMDNLEETIWPIYEGEFPGMDEDLAIGLLPIFQEEFDLTDDEIQNIIDHLLSIEDHLSNPETLERLLELSDRMMAFEEFDTASELSLEQIAEIASIFEELLSIFKLNAAYSLVKGDAETPVSLLDLMNLDELKGANLKIVLSGVEGKFLADLIIKGEMIDSETIIETGEQIEETVEEVTKPVEKSPVEKPEVQKASPVKKPEKNSVEGARLPDTAMNYMTYALLGLFVALAGIILYRKARTA